MNKIWKKGQRYKIIIHVFLVVSSLCFVLPLMMVISLSFSSEREILRGGVGLFPKEFTTEAYELAFSDPDEIIDAYVVTIAESVIGTAGALVISGMLAYALSRTNFAYKGPITFIVFFTMLFSGGAIPSYIVNTQYYHLGNKFLIYILPGLAGGAWGTLMIRTFFKGLPESLFESAKLDGASELKIFVKIAAPLSKPVFATVGFMGLVGRWNNWTTSMIYIRDTRLYTLQYLLQRVLRETQFAQSLAEQGLSINVAELLEEQPAETLKYALCVIAAGPMLMVFPFFQKYFVKGTTIGAVKG